MSTPTTSSSAVPIELVEFGWSLKRVKDALKPYQAINVSKSLETDFFTRSSDAIEHARDLTVEWEEADAMRAEGNKLSVSAPAIAASLDIPADKLQSGAPATTESELAEQITKEEHDWEKSCLFTQKGGYDTYRCNRCGATSKRYGVSWPPTLDKKQPKDCPVPKPAVEAASPVEIERPTASESEDLAAEANAVIDEAKTSPAAAATEEAARISIADEIGENQLFPVDLIRTNGGTQPRAELNLLIISEYKEAMQGGAVFPAVDVFYDGTDYWLADGFHRHRATIEAEIEEIHANVRQGTQRDAVLYSLGANATHGLPRSPEDKRRAVMTLLEDSEWQQWSNRAIAEAANVSHTFVGNLRHDREGSTVNVSSQTLRKGRDGRTTDTANIGAGQEPDDRQTYIESVVDRKCRVELFEEAAQKNEAINRANEADWSPAEFAAVLERHGGVLYKRQLEEMGCTLGAILHALEQGAIVQPETGKFTLPGHKPQSSVEPAKEQRARTESASAPAKSKPPIEELLKGRKLSVSFVFGVAPGKVSLSINTDLKNLAAAQRKLIDIDSARGFSGDVMDLIKSALIKSALNQALARTVKVVKKQSAPKKSAKKTPPKSKPASKKKPAKKSQKGRKR